VAEVGVVGKERAKLKLDCMRREAIIIRYRDIDTFHLIVSL